MISFVPYNTAVGQSSIQVRICSSSQAFRGTDLLQREWDTYNPITDPEDPNLSCNINGAVLAAQKSATVTGMLRLKSFLKLQS